MIRIKSMNQVDIIDLIPVELFEFEIDSASSLPIRTYTINLSTYLIGENSTAYNIETKSKYVYTNNAWTKIAGESEVTPNNNTITEDGTYSIPNNEYLGYTNVVVKTSEEPTSDITIIRDDYTKDGHTAYLPKTLTVNSGDLMSFCVWVLNESDSECTLKWYNDEALVDSFTTYIQPSTDGEPTNFSEMGISQTVTIPTTVVISARIEGTNIQEDCTITINP